MPREDGYSRAIPLRFLPALPPQAIPVDGAVRGEWQAGLDFLRWLREGLDARGRGAEPVLALADGSFDTLEMWRGLPVRTFLATRTPRNRRLFWLPNLDAHPGPGRPASYGEQAPHPADWLHAGLRHWPQAHVRVRGRSILMRYQLLGPFAREGVPERPLFPIVVKGMHHRVGVRVQHFTDLDPSFYLISAGQHPGSWQLPFPIEFLLAWLWQPWEIEVAHREMKSGLGIGEKQCWNKRSAVLAVLWSAWSYALLVPAGYRT